MVDLSALARLKASREVREGLEEAARKHDESSVALAQNRRNDALKKWNERYGEDDDDDLLQARPCARPTAAATASAGTAGRDMSTATATIASQGDKSATTPPERTQKQGGIRDYDYDAVMQLEPTDLWPSSFDRDHLGLAQDIMSGEVATLADTSREGGGEDDNTAATAAAVAAAATTAAAYVAAGHTIDGDAYAAAYSTTRANTQADQNRIISWRWTRLAEARATLAGPDAVERFLFARQVAEAEASLDAVWASSLALKAWVEKAIEVEGAVQHNTTQAHYRFLTQTLALDAAKNRCQRARSTFDLWAACGGVEGSAGTRCITGRRRRRRRHASASASASASAPSARVSGDSVAAATTAAAAGTATATVVAESVTVCAVRQSGTKRVRETRDTVVTANSTVQTAAAASSSAAGEHGLGRKRRRRMIDLVTREHKGGGRGGIDVGGGGSGGGSGGVGECVSGVEDEAVGKKRRALGEVAGEATAMDTSEDQASEHTEYVSH